MSRGLPHDQDRQPQQRRREGRGRHPRPPPYWFTLGTFRTLKKRLVHPPPAAEEERYFMFIAPRYNIQLEDVVANKHLPPLSLQDFEDYLEHVDGTPENLHFHLWLQYYRRLYNDWAESVLPGVNLPSSSTGGYRPRDLWERLHHCQSRLLKEQFSFAKSHFFEGDAPMKLNISDDPRQSVLSISNLPPQESRELTDKLPSFPNQPEPGLFDAILREVDAALTVACKRFVRLAFSNSGLWHSCLGHLLGCAILASGLVLWSMGVAKTAGRNFIVASLVLIWIGVWFMLVSLNGHCLGVYFTGDARQLYPHEFARSLPPDIVPPPIYSLVPPPEEPPPTYSWNRKPSGASISVLPPPSLAATPVAPQRSYQLWSYLNAGKRRSEGMLRMFGRREEDDDGVTLELGTRRGADPAAGIELKLPPARRTKDLPRQSFNIETPIADHESGTIPGLAPPPAALTARRGAVDMSVGWEEQLEAQQYRLEFNQPDLPDSPGEFTEENDFGIIVSEAFEEDAPYQYMPTPYPPSYPFPQPDDALLGSRQIVDPPLPQTSVRGALAPLAPLIQGPEFPVQWRRTMPDIFAPHPRQDETRSAEATVKHSKSNPVLDWIAKESASRRGSRSTDAGSSGSGTVWPWPRSLLGPMTLVHSPLVKRAHWVVTVRCAMVALAVTCGMALGLVR